MENTSTITKTITIIGGIAPSGKWVFFLPEADLSNLDESKVQRFTFEVEPATTKHSVAASGQTYEVLERLGLTSGGEGVIAPGTYTAALRLTTVLLRCRRLAMPGGDMVAPTVAEMFTVPAPVLQQFQYEVGRADELTKDDLAFFTVPAAEDKAEASENEKTQSGS